MVREKAEMVIRPSVRSVLEKGASGEGISRSEALLLMQIGSPSSELYALFAAADELTRRLSQNRGECHAQIGLNIGPCTKNCRFCAFAKDVRVFQGRSKLGDEEVIVRAMEFVQEGANAIYLMTTGDFDLNDFVRVGRVARRAIPQEVPLIANIGDFGPDEALGLREAGFQGIYHTVRMGEGKDTGISPATRLATIAAAKGAGLAVGYCVEPIGPEHSPEEIVDKMFIGLDCGVAYSGAMKRYTVSGAPLAGRGVLSDVVVAKVVSIAALVMGDTVSATCTHEPNLLGFRAGANLSWAETGPNPRDDEEDTSRGRGSPVARVKAMFRDASYEALSGPSRAFCPSW